ncbi:hypothetical protein, partial [Bifidobacterium pullorum]|uniref:hypothetical protein n=1 Tax=Bifidobacterium pullorum TaxID=78448 RepID=UPI00195AE71E
PINSRMLCQLSYAGMFRARRTAAHKKIRIAVNDTSATSACRNGGGGHVSVDNLMAFDHIVGLGWT